MPDGVTSPYAPPAPNRSLRIIKPDPYSQLFSKWNCVKYVNIGIALIILYWAATDTNWISALAKLGILVLQIGYYFKNLYNYRKLNETWDHWEFRIRTLFKQDVYVKFKADIEDLDDLFQLTEVIIIIPFEKVMLKFKGNRYCVMWKVFTKSIDQDIITNLEAQVKGHLDGLPDNVVFGSNWYSVDTHKYLTRKVIDEAILNNEHTKPRDLHNQALMSYVTLNNSPQSVVKHVYTQELGVFSDDAEAAIQYDSIIPGIEEILGSSFTQVERVTTFEDAIMIFKEIWEEGEVKEWIKQ